jgi:NADH:ubiquinone reductase (H+-translocating)
MAERKRVVILGGGFAGVYAAKYLEKSLGNKDDFEIILLSKENYFVFQPMLPELISGTIGLLDIVCPLRPLLPKTNVQSREVESIDLVAQTVTTSHGFRAKPHVIQYDHLVIALGNVTDFRGMRGLPEHAMPFKNLADAIHLRNHVIRALEEAAIEVEDEELRKQLLTFVIAGGGFSGVEVAAELNDFVRTVARSYRGIKASDIRVVLVHSQGRILPEVSESLGNFAQKILQKRGVELMLNTRLDAATSEHAILANGQIIPTRTLVSTVPSSPHPLVESLALPKNKAGKLKAKNTLAVEGFKNIWALGDCALVPEPFTEGFCPPTAQHAIRQGKTVAHNIVASMRGGSQLAFDFGGLGKMGSLGHHCAVADIMGLNISGFLAFAMWRAIYLMKLPGWGRRLKVATSWALDFFLPPELTELKLAASSGIAEQHYEPGEEVFHQGELGDRMYIILAGRADVIRTDNGVERVLAQLGPGEYFGEMALLQKATRNATIRCTEPMNTLSIPQKEFNVLSSSLPQLKKSFEQKIETREEKSAATKVG